MTLPSGASFENDARPECTSQIMRFSPTTDADCATAWYWHGERSAAHRLHGEGITPVMYDKNAYHGGHTASFRYDSGFLFDVEPHISLPKIRASKSGRR